MGLRSKFHGYWDKDLMKFVEGDPPARETYGEAPLFISDEIKPFRHPATGQVVSSKSELNRINKATGCIETAPGEKVAQKKRRDGVDWDQAMQKAIHQIDNGMAPLDERTREMCKQQNELVSKALGFDAFNVAGRKNGSRKRKR